MKVFEQVLTVRPEHLDDLNHVNNVVYLQWVQDVASAHWNAIAAAEMKQRYSWVVLKHEIEYFAPAFLNDIIKARTWVHQSEGVRSERHVELYNQQTGKLLVRAKTNWCLLDAQTMKPRRIERDILNLFH
ncbi:MAG: acyl-CoA thioesterase [Flammeovirgaceae bacterium]|nr:MAG: acyl-CoA thioesterase [Flammeovirgaceae bacterium]